MGVTGQVVEGERLTAVAGIGGLLLILCLLAVDRFQSFRPIVFLGFLSMLGGGPPLAAAVVWMGEKSGLLGSPLGRILIIVVKGLLVALAITLIVYLVARARTWPQPVPSSTLEIAFVLTVAVTAVILLVPSGPWHANGARIDPLLVIAGALAVFMLSPFDAAAPSPVGLLAYAQSAPNFGWWALCGGVWVAVGLALRRHEGWAFRRGSTLFLWVAVLATIAVILSLYDDSHFVDMGHYMPLVGPAMNALHGARPMVEAYSVYGLLPWVLHLVAYEMFTPTFGTSAVVVRFLNIAYFLVIFLILYHVVRRRLSALWFFIPALLVAITSHNPGPTGMWNMNSLPMTLGGRNLLPAIMTLLLVVAPLRGWGRWACLGVLALASLSSVEILAFTFAPWFYCLGLDAVRRRSVRLLTANIAWAVGIILLAHTMLAAGIYLWTGALVAYLPYFELFLFFRPAEESIWSVPFVPNYALWLPIGLAYFLVMAAAAHRALRGEPANTLVDRLLPVAVMGLGPLAYFFGRPQEGTLNIACLSFAVVAIGAAEALLSRPRRFGPVGPAMAGVTVLAFAFISADGFEHFMRPLDPSRGNASILRRCLTSEGCRLAEVPRNINLALSTQPLDPRTKVGFYIGEAAPRIEEVIAMLQRVTSQSRLVGMLTEDQPARYADANSALGMVAFMATGQWFAWSISSPLIDGDSSLITDQILQRVSATPSGMPVIVANERKSWVPLNQQILDRLTLRCRLSLVEEGRHFTAFITKDCAG